MKYKDKLLISLFGIMLFLPIISSIFGIGQNLILEENRELAILPKVGFYKTFPIQFTNYFADHFGLRNWLIVADRMMRYQIFNVSPNKAITIGKDNWLFYTPDVNYIDTVNAQPFSVGDLQQIKTNLETVRNEFASRGIKFYFMAAPNKQSIYPEYLPNYMKAVRPESRLDQLSNYLENDKSFIFINPKNELQVAKSNTPVYLKYDTHWNEMGAFVAYQKLFQRIVRDFPGLKSKNINDFVISQKVAVSKDLAIQMGVEGNFSENTPVFSREGNKAKIVFEDCPKLFTGCPLTIREATDTKQLKLVMYRDSFGAAIIPFISEHFRRSYFYWGTIPLPTSIIDSEKPNIVIWELTERELWRLKDKLFYF
jgi:hypothetical protein